MHLPAAGVTTAAAGFIFLSNAPGVRNGIAIVNNNKSMPMRTFIPDEMILPSITEQPLIKTRASADFM